MEVLKVATIELPAELPRRPGVAALTPREIELLADPGTEIARGHDSQVHRCSESDQIYKVYNRLSAERLLRYQGITDDSIRLLANWRPDEVFNQNGVRLAVGIRVLPIERVALDEQGRAVSVSRYVAGKNLSDELNLLSHGRVGEIFTSDFESEEIMMKTSCFLHDLSRALDDRLGTRNLYVVTTNTKLNFSDNGPELVITDLCAFVDKFRKIR